MKNSGIEKRKHRIRPLYNTRWQSSVSPRPWATATRTETAPLRPISTDVVVAFT